MNNLSALKETPDFTLKNITAEISESDLFKDLAGANIPLSGESTFKELDPFLNPNPNPNPNPINNPITDKYQMGTGNNKINLGNLLDAELCTKLIDTLIPSLLVLSLKMGGINVKKNQLQASTREMEAMKPIVQKCLEQIELNINNPFIALGIVMGTIYTTKAAELGFDQYMGDGRKTSSNTSNYSESSEPRTRKPRSDKGQKRN